MTVSIEFWQLAALCLFCVAGTWVGCRIEEGSIAWRVASGVSAEMAKAFKRLDGSTKIQMRATFTGIKLASSYGHDSWNASVELPFGSVLTVTVNPETGAALARHVGSRAIVEVDFCVLEEKP